jgi:predicted Mrr-cat superfamily restriction endonuclease
LDLQTIIKQAHKEWKENPLKAKEEQEVISKYGKMFHPKNIDNLTAKDFQSFLNYKNNKHWKSLERGGPAIIRDMEKFKKTLKVLLDESVPIDERIKRIRDTKSSEYHKGFGSAYYTPILLVVYPNKYPVINNIVKYALEKINLYPDYNSKTEWIAYKEIIPKISELAEKNHISLWQMDWVWWHIYSTLDYEGLYNFITKTMDAKTTYQPIMIRTLLEKGSASKETIDEIIRLENPEKDKKFVSNEVYEVLVDKHQIVKVDENSYKLNLLQPLTSIEQDKLVKLCNQEIIRIREKQVQIENKDIQYFLVQVNEFGSKNILNNNIYEHQNWYQTPRDKDHGIVQSGDILLVYFASQSIQYKKQLKKIYRVIDVKENHVSFQLSEEIELNGLTLDTIKEAIKTGKLSTIFNKISQQGFNITKIDKTDYDSILFLDKISTEKASKDPNVWIVRAGDTGQGEQSALENNCISIGYNGLPELHHIKDFEKFKEHYMKTHPNENIGRVGKVVSQIWDFIFEIKIGDFIILPLKLHKSKLIAVGKVLGEYQYENLNSIQQFRPVKWLKKDVNINDFDNNFVKLFDKHGTVYRIGGLTDVNKLKDMLKRLGVKEIDLETMSNMSNKSIQLENNENKKPLSLEDISKITYFPIQVLKEIEYLLIEKKQIIFYGSPGTSKTFLARKFSEYFTNNKENVRIIQFHQSYSYEDFIEGIKPKISENGEATGFTLQSGLFKNLVKECVENPTNRFVLIIDEINRGNISKIFGELIYLLEYRDEKISLTYSPFEKFYIPSNLYIIGTMNSADRSIAFVDYALRRRFYFKEFYPDTNGDILYSWYKTNNIKEVDPKQIITLLNEINKKISELIGREYQIGYSYFMVKNLDRIKLKNIIDYAITPLVEQYFFGKKQKVEEIKQIWSSILNTTTSDSQTSIL